MEQRSGLLWTVGLKDYSVFESSTGLLLTGLQQAHFAILEVHIKINEKGAVLAHFAILEGLQIKINEKGAVLQGLRMHW